MPDPQQDAAFREALLQMLAGAQAPHTPPPVASHPASDAVLLESLRTRANPRPSAGPLGPSRIGPGNATPETKLGLLTTPVTGQMSDAEGLAALQEVGKIQPTIEQAPFLTLDDVAVRMGKPLGAFRTVVEQRPSGELTVAIKDAVAKMYGGKPYEETAGWMDLGSNVIDDHLTVDNVFLYDDYRGKGLGSELYQEALNEAKTRGHRGLASAPHARNRMSERIWKGRPGVTESESGSYELMSDYLPRQGQAPPPVAAPPPPQYVAPGQPHPLIRLLMAQKTR